MKRAKWLLLIVLVVLAFSKLFLWDRSPVPAHDFSYYLDDPSAMRLVEIMSGRSNPERRELVKKALEAGGVSYREEAVLNPVFSGSNVVVELGQGRDVLVFSAHMDRVEEAPGANDNASCVAAGILAMKELSRINPPEGLSVRFLFSDGEEAGLHGARHHAETQNLSNIFGVASFELCGIGDAYGVWDVVGPALGSPIVKALLKAGDNLKIYNGKHGAVPRFGSDHLAFSKKGLAAVGVTVLPQKDEEKLRSYVDDPNNPKWLLNFIRPTIFQTYHTSGDGPQTVDPPALELTTRLMLETIRVVGEMVKENG
ncbi:MAG: M28 family peptidase [Rhodospirillales bacterium]|nr:M28 family peptidase [Rhodospirillales bacterium]